MMLTKKLSIHQQKEILNALFGFNLEKVSNENEPEVYILYDENGNEFYKSPTNGCFDFSTLTGVFSYTAHRAKNQGFNDCQLQIRKNLGLN